MNMRNGISVPDNPVRDDRHKYNFTVTGITGAGKTGLLSELIKKRLRENKKGAKS